MYVNKYLFLITLLLVSMFIHHLQGVFFIMYAKVTKFKKILIFMFCNSSIDNKKQIIVNIQGVTGGRDKTSGGCSLC
jgi:hypothetical protein